MHRSAMVMHKEDRLVFSELSENCQEDLLRELPSKVKNCYDNDPVKKRGDRGGELIVMKGR